MIEDFSYSARDGLTLAGRDYGPGVGLSLPVICLPGLTRTTRDFDELGQILAARGRHVVAFDYRGRGRSDRDPTGASYTVAAELDDVILGMAARGIARAIIVGTSRGGIITMSMAASRPDLVAGAVLNDIGSIVDTAGLLRIKSYVGKTSGPADWIEGAAMLRALHGPFFPAYSDRDWQAQASLTFADDNGRPVADYDPLLARGFEALTAEAPSVDLTPLFATLAAIPTLVIRGSHSDLLSGETVAAMTALHPGLVAIEAEGEGHPPALRGALALRVADFIDAIG